ncbi:hypothetical protein [Helicobacter sp. 13S00477-4]|uniref:hypothetical protein n=1 Tax=Helicobacter sp. 13S00477-4 TaxID=1905759 RepID=UPI000BA5FD31|nr:hypothetical protein [Helicobacter sp. 13S00477-4]PAF52058.1 hypothetical protein BKH44_04075 [Helicobacter sp. 13S00477-4]
MNPNAFFIIISFVIVLGIFFVALVLLLNKKKQKFQTVIEDIVSYETVMLLINSKYSTLKDLEKATKFFFDNYQDWHLSKTQKKNFLFSICVHKSVNSKIIINIQNKLTVLNPQLKEEFEKVVKQAIDIR